MVTIVIFLEHDQTLQNPAKVTSKKILAVTTNVAVLIVATKLLYNLKRNEHII